MPGGSSATEEPARSGPPPSLLGATGGTEGSAGQDDQATDPTTGLHGRYRQPPPLLLKERADGRSTAY